MNYLITGLPRSKTAWMSVVASTVAGSLCYHEPMARLKRWECCFDLWEHAPYDHVGIADAHLGFHLDRVISESSPRVLVIQRDIAEVKESLRKMSAVHSNYCDLLGAALDKYRVHPLFMWVSFDALNKVAIIQRCLEHLIPQCRPDAERIKQLIDLNVQSDMEVAWQRALQSRADVHKILGTESIPGLDFYQ